jgi:cholesterol oxidase
MSNRFSYNLAPHRHNLDDVALFDYPAALAKLREHIGGRRLHVISHCLGAVSFAMSLFGGVVSDVTSVVANSVALTPRVPSWSAFKLAVAPFLLEKVLGFQYVSPRWAEEPGLSRGKLFSRGVSLFHRECDVPACHMLSMMWGTGGPAVYGHHRIHEITHRRGADLYGGTSFNYHRHVHAMVKAGRAIKLRPTDTAYDRLPDDYLSCARDVTTPVLLVTGDDNKVFADSNIACHRALEELTPGRHELHVFRDYGHQDVFMGKNASADVFPRLIRFLDERRGPPVTLRAVRRRPGPPMARSA